MNSGGLRSLGLWDRYLTLWVFTAMAAGVALGYLFPWLADAIGSFTVGTTNIPIAIGLILMMYSPLAKVRYGEMPKVFKSKRLIVLSLVLNWVLCPLLMLVLAVVFLRDAPDYMAGIIMIGLARCIAMVLVWNDFAGGSNEYAAGLVAVNAVFQIAFYGPMAWLFLSVLAPMLGAPGMSIEVSAWQIAQSVLIYLGIPLVAGALTRFIGVRRFGEEGYSARVLPKTSKITPVALLFTIVIMFSMKGEMISSLAPGRAENRSASGRLLRRDVLCKRMAGSSCWRGLREDGVRCLHRYWQ